METARDDLFGAMQKVDNSFFAVMIRFLDDVLSSEQVQLRSGGRPPRTTTVL